MLTRRQQIEAIEYISESGSWDRQFLWATRTTPTTARRLNEVFLILAGLAMLGSVFGALYLGNKFLDKYNFGNSGVNRTEIDAFKKKVNELLAQNKGYNEKFKKDLKSHMEKQEFDPEFIKKFLEDSENEAEKKQKENEEQLGLLNQFLQENDPNDKDFEANFNKFLQEKMPDLYDLVQKDKEFKITSPEDVEKLKSKIPEIKKSLKDNKVEAPEGWETKLSDAIGSSESVHSESRRTQLALIIERASRILLEDADDDTEDGSDWTADFRPDGWNEMMSSIKDEEKFSSFRQLMSAFGLEKIELAPEGVDADDAVVGQIEDDASQVQDAITDVVNQAANADNKPSVNDVVDLTEKEWFENLSSREQNRINQNSRYENLKSVINSELPPKNDNPSGTKVKSNIENWRNDEKNQTLKNPKNFSQKKLDALQNSIPKIVDEFGKENENITESAQVFDRWGRLAGLLK